MSPTESSGFRLSTINSRLSGASPRMSAHAEELVDLRSRPSSRAIPAKPKRSFRATAKSDQLEIEVEQLAVELLALQQPMAAFSDSLERDQDL